MAYVLCYSATQLSLLLVIFHIFLFPFSALRFPLIFKIYLLFSYLDLRARVAVHN